MRPISLVLSLGTGRPPQTPVNAIDVYRPGGVFDVYKVMQGAQSLIKLLVEQVVAVVLLCVSMAALHYDESCPLLLIQTAYFPIVSRSLWF